MPQLTRKIQAIEQEILRMGALVKCSFHLIGLFVTVICKQLNN